jgi:UDP-N-acetylmuramate--alanine ligase
MHAPVPGMSFGIRRVLTTNERSFTNLVALDRNLCDYDPKLIDIEKVRLTSKLLPYQHVHIVGIGGFGMSAIARILLGSGYVVSGSDEKANALTEALARDGATIYIGHQAEHILGVDAVLASSAVPDTNPELQEAARKSVPVLRRRDAIGFVTANYRTLAVAGTHGKTTTTALLTHVLTAARLDPSAIVGGVMQNLGGNARVGNSEFFVIEADEYGDMFLGLTPEIAIVTNIEYDHPDQFATMDAMVQTFKDFVGQIKPDGLLVAGIDSPPVAGIAENRHWNGLPTATYSLIDHEAHWFASDIINTVPGISHFAVHYEESLVGYTELKLAGKHNVQNALAVIAGATHLGVPFETIASALATFEGTQRRSEILGQVAGVTVVNDYAHHPTAIRMTLEAWAEGVGQLWAVWQPHTYNRLRALADEFVHSFARADHVIVTAVYSVREAISPGLTPSDLVGEIQKLGHPDARYCDDFEQAAVLLVNEVGNGDTVVILSAGDAPKIGYRLLDLLDEKARFERRPHG